MASATQHVLFFAWVLAWATVSTPLVCGSSGVTQGVKGRRLLLTPGPAASPLEEDTEVTTQAEPDEMTTAQAAARLPGFSPSAAALLPFGSPAVAATVTIPEVGDVDDETLCEMCPGECPRFCYCKTGECVTTRPAGGSPVSSGTCAACAQSGCSVFWWC